jgi:hypothetical protein
MSAWLWLRVLELGSRDEASHWTARYITTVRAEETNLF